MNKYLNFNPHHTGEAVRLYYMSKRSNIEIVVSGHIDKALRQLKKKIEREGIVRDMKRTVYFESTTQKRRKRLVRAIKQNMMRMITQGTVSQE